MIIKEKIAELTEQFLPEIIAVRRHIHANPELSFVEYNTSAFVESKLREYNIRIDRKVAKTGIVAVIEGKNPGKRVIAVRSELDALPIVEENEVEYKSKNEGVMHACGHDVHTSALLGAARILKELADELEGTVKLFFQPGEEKLPGGASLMIKEGVLSEDMPAALLGQHVLPAIDAGKVGFRSGMYMASADEIYITVKGKGGHAALPRQIINPLNIAAEIILAFRDIVPRKKEMGDVPSVLAFGKITGEGATNVIPDEVKIEGTFRTMNEEWRAEAHEKMVNMASDIAKTRGGSCEINIVKGYPFLVNDEAVTKRARNYAEEYLGAENVEELDLRMTADDFAFFSQQVPSCYYRIGIRNESCGITSGVHTSTFDIDDKALETGMGLMAWIVVNELSG